MTSVEDRTRAAMDAITGQVDGAPPLPLPPPPGAASRRRWRAPSPGRRWGSWLAPAAAAAAVIALAIALVVVRDTPDRSPAPTVSPAGAPVDFPRYYVTFSQPRGESSVPVGLALRETLTGKTLFTLQPPPGVSFAGITAAADDRTFVADAHRDPYGTPGSEGRSRTWYLLRVTGTGSRVSLTMTRLPIPRTPVGAQIIGIALSPDGTKLAVATMPLADSFRTTRQLLRVYSVVTGAVLRSWSTPPGQWALMGAGGEGGDPNTSIAWIGNHALAFAGSTLKAGRPPFVLRVMVLDISRPNGDLRASSRATTTVPTTFGGSTRTPFGCDPIWRGNVLVTGDGKSFVCGGYGTSGAQLPEYLCNRGTAWNTAAFAGFSLATGKSRFLSGYRTTCDGLAVVAYPVWVNATGSAVIGWMHFTNQRPGLFGVFSHGSFRPIPNPVPGSDYQTDAGTILYQVAW